MSSKKYSKLKIPLDLRMNIIINIVELYSVDLNEYKIPSEHLAVLMNNTMAKVCAMTEFLETNLTLLCRNMVITFLF